MCRKSPVCRFSLGEPITRSLLNYQFVDRRPIVAGRKEERGAHRGLRRGYEISALIYSAALRSRSASIELRLRNFLEIRIAL